MSSAIIEVRAVTRRFDEIVAVDSVDLAVSPGEVFGVIGHNGAGKSTLFKMMLGLLAPSAGEIRIDGRTVGGAGFREVRRDIAYLPENIVFYDNLTGLETLVFFARLKGAEPRSCAALLDKVGLAPAAHRAVRGYSKGMRQRLGFAQALLGHPRILILDEPTTGLDPEGISDFYAMLHALRQTGVTALLSSHNLAQIQERVDRLALLKSGRLQAVGTVRELREALRLPLSLEVQLQAAGEPALRRALAGLSGCEVHVTDGAATIRCDQAQKMPVLAALAPLTDTIADIRIREPSLEDVFLGYADH